jgi:hypothetical protein
MAGSARSFQIAVLLVHCVAAFEVCRERDG